MRGPKPRDPIDRFVEKVDYGSHDGCWGWMADKCNGYGMFRVGSKMLRAHRVAWELAVGPVPEKMLLHHVCHNKGCVNPDHLEVVSKRENTLEAESASAVNARKTHCVRGHPFDGENTYSPRPQRRQCRACGRAAQKRYRRRKLEA